MTELICQIWREIALDMDIDISLPNIRTALQQQLPHERLMLRRYDVSTHSVQTIATLPDPVEQGERGSAPVGEREQALDWFLAGEGVVFRSDQAPAGLAGLVPTYLEGWLLVCPLCAAEQPLGVLIVQRTLSRKFTEAERALSSRLQEPLAAALGNHRQLHDLRNLREKVEADNRSLLSRLDRQDISDSVIGAETGLRSVSERIELVGGADVPVLLLGETGSGKEVVARSLHSRSRRVSGTFLRVNCGAIPSELIDSHLFGHERGSFSGAAGQHKGWFERADGGTLFLDEIGDLPLPAQVRLLRVLQDGSFERVGGQRSLRVDVRIIAATHRDLRAMVASGQFREDLWYRIAVFPIAIPPLRDRREDIPVLAAHFSLRSAKRLGALPITPLPEDNRMLMAYDWPGNVRELAAVMERAVILGNGRRLEIAKALGLGNPSSDTSSTPLLPARHEDIDCLDAAMARHIERALAATRGRIEGDGGAAQLLGINPHTLRGRMRKLGIDWMRFRLRNSSGQELGR